MIEDSINNAYFKWMYNLVCSNRYANEISYKRLLMELHNTEFTFTISRDENRAEDGLDLRYRFAYDYSEVYDYADRYIKGPCSVLEMMIALAIRSEEFMDDPSIGNRTGQWFWSMIVNLGLGAMTDRRFDKLYVKERIERFLNRDYEPDGKGGLFRIKNCEDDLRKVEIWYQMCWYMDGLM